MKFTPFEFKPQQGGTPMPALNGVHHFAYKCRNAEETRRFYEEIMGCPLIYAIEYEDLETTTGETLSFLHIFFRMADGSLLAFFDLGDERCSAKDPGTPEFINHLALAIDGEEELQAAKARLEAAGLDVLGPIDHDGLVRSIYFWDPNGVRLELTYTIADEAHMATGQAEAHEKLKTWTSKMTPAA